MEGAHDLGGVGGFGTTRVADGDLTHHEAWELRAQWLALAVCRGARPWLERIDTPTYLTTQYYARWMMAAELAGVDRGVLTRSELDAAKERIAAGGEVPQRFDPAMAERVRQSLRTPEPSAPAGQCRFAVGDPVRPKRIHDDAAHHRIPRYVRGVVGVVESICGRERLAGYRGFDAVEPYYTVRFSSTDVWGDQSARGERPYLLHVDLWEQYLEAAA